MESNRLQSSDPRENREIIEQVIQLAETWDMFKKTQHERENSDYDPSEPEEKYVPFVRLREYVNSLSSEQLDAVYCAYELGGGLDGYEPPKLTGSEDEDDEDEGSRFNSIQEWVEWVIGDYMGTKNAEPNWIDNKRDADRLISMNSLSKCLKLAINYMFDDTIYSL